MFETGRSARIDRYAEMSSGPLGAHIRDAGIRSSVGTPIVVEGRVWGLIAAASFLEEPLPVDAEARLGDFTELVATAIANAESRAGLARLAEEQAALRRVATLVARGTAPEEDTSSSPITTRSDSDIGQPYRADRACSYSPPSSCARGA